jgi:transposase-like protein
MATAKLQHPNAALTQRGRLKMVRLVINDGWTIEATADKFQVDAKTVTKWRDRFLTEGRDGLIDRSSRPRSSPNQTPLECRRRIIELRKQRRWGAAYIGHEVGRAGSTVQTILVAAGIGRLDSADRAPLNQSSDISVTGQASWSTSTSRSSLGSLTAAAGGSTGEANRRQRSGPRPATGSYIRRSMTGPGLSIQRSTPTNKPSPLSASDPGKRVLQPARNRRRTSHHRQRGLLPIKALADHARRTPDHPEVHTALPATNERQGL